MSDHQRAPGIILALFLCLLPSTVTSLPAASLGTQLTTTEKQQLQREARLVVDLLQNHHYSGRAFREIANSEMVGRFLQELDPGADFFTTEDVEFAHRRFDRTLKSVYLFRGDLQPAFEIFDLFSSRARERLAWVARRLTRDFDLTVDESFETPRQATPTAAGEAADQRWERRLKDSVLREILAGRSPDAAREQVAKYYREIGRRIDTVDSFVVRERFLDAIIRSFDPHSGYFSADSTREFEVDMENAVIGVGLDLRKDEGRCVIAAVQPGGPADLHSRIRPGDILVALADGDGPWIDAAAQRLRETAALIRGEPGRPLRLAYQPEGSTERIEVTIQRARVVLPSDRVHGAVSDVPDGTGRNRPIGWILLPSFYAGGEGPNATSAAKDMRELLDQMAGQKIEGLVIDLRQNPGGALTEAVAISQLFLPRGLMMFSRGLNGKLTEHMLKDEPPAYSGPLVLLTSAQSASASEILAGALKFHRRAIVAGGATTFGKGTSQNYIPLAKLPGIDPKTAKDWGTLRLTAERFFLPDGRAVQRAGVGSQIILPDFDPPGFEREAALPHALPEESVTPPATAADTVPIQPTTPDDLLRHLHAVAEHDFQTLPEWGLWRAEQKYQREQVERQAHQLQLAARQKDWDETLHAFQALQVTRRALTASVAFPTRPLEIASVQAAFAAHEARWRTLDQTTGASVLHRLHQGGFFVENDQGRLREIRLDHLGVTAFYGDTEALAAAFAEAAARPTTAAEARRILEELALLESKTDEALLAAVARVTGAALPDAAVRRGTEALLRRLTELDSEMRRTRPGLDVPMRESQRAAAAWAAWLAGSRAP